MYETERLILKTAEETSPLQVLQYYNINKNFLKPWEIEKEEGFYTIENQTENIECEKNNLKNGTGLKLFITLEEDTDKLVGIVNFSNIIWGGFMSCFLGYSLDRNMTKKGYMSEAIKKGIDIIFNEYEVHRIEGNVMPRNHDSINLLKRLKFIEEGIAINYLKINGIWEDHIHMTLLNE